MALDFSLKRRGSPIDENPPKRQVLEDTVNILDLSDCVLLNILKRLKATDLFHFGITCRRFASLVKDHSLWVRVDGRSSSNSKEKIAFVWENVGEKTKHLLLAGSKRTQFILSTKMLASSAVLSNLTVLALEYQCIKYCRLNDFPTSLQEVSLRHSYVPRHSVFFRFSEKQMCNLKTLILDHCQWLQASCFTSIGKYPSLEILSLYMCKKFVEDEIAYVSLAGRCGFPSLKVADLRFTGFGDLFIKSFHSKPSLQIIYFQCFPSTYQMERYERKLNIMHGSKMEENSYISDDEDNNDTSKESLRMRFNATSLQEYNVQTVSDGTMMYLARLKKTPGAKPRPFSVLYKYPYQSTCTCGHQEPKKHKENSAVNSLWEEESLKNKLRNEIVRQHANRLTRRNGSIHFMYPSSKMICKKITFDSCMIPDWCNVEATYESPQQKWLYTRDARNDYEVAMIEHTDKHFQVRVSRRCGADRQCSCSSLQPNIPIIVAGPHALFPDYHADAATRDNQYPTLVANSIADCIIKIKNSDDPKLESESISYNFLIEFLRHYKIYSDMLEDQAFLERICSIFYELSVCITFDVHRVIKYHTLCIDDLVKFLVFQNAPKLFLLTFFTNLLQCESSEINSSSSLNQPGPSGSYDERRSNSSFQQDPGTENYPLPGIPLLNRPPHVRRIFCNDPMELDPVVLYHNEPHEKLPTSITELSLRGYFNVSDNTLVHIKDLELELLDVTGTNVTEDGMAQFLTYNPQCRLIHESKCVCRPSLHF